MQQTYSEIATGDAGVAAQAAHNRKLLKSVEVCKAEGLHFVPLAWESTGGTTDCVHETIRKWTDLKEATPWSSFARTCTLKSPAAFKLTWRRRCSTAFRSALALVLFKGRVL